MKWTAIVLTGVFIISTAVLHAQQPLPLDVFNFTPYSDENGVLLEDGDILHLLWAGPDALIDPPVKDIGGANNGQPTGDDELLETHAIGENFPPGFGQFSFTVTTYPDQSSGKPAAGDLIYLRAFNDNDLVTATFYGDAQLHAVQNVLGESYDPLIDMGQTDQALPVELISFEAIPGDKQVELKWTTGSEVNNLGFKVTRSPFEEGEYQLISSYEINDDLRGAGSSNRENSYNYVDRSVLNGETYWYKLIDVDFNGEEFSHSPISVTLEPKPIPKEFILFQNYPNPFNPETKLEFGVPEKAERLRIQIEVYDVLGQKVKTLVDQEYEPGYHSVIWDGRNDNGQQLASGLYFFQLKSSLFVQTRKLLLLR